MEADFEANTTDAIVCDVVIVGGGGAGLSAAVQSAQLGLKAVLIEKNERLGGTTARSVGSITASRTSLQRAAGVEDDTESHFVDMGLFAGTNANRDNSDLRRVYVENSGPSFEWLRSLGVAFFGPMPEPPHSKPRMHNVLPNSGAYIHHLHRAAKRLGVTVLTSTNAVDLIRAADGAIAGLVCERGGRRLRIEAGGGVVLAAGDFSSSREFKREFIGELAAEVSGINPTSTGDGIRLGVSAGGKVMNGDLALGPELRFHAPARKRLLHLIPPARPFTLAMQMVIRFMPDAIMRPIVMSFATSWLAPTPRLFTQGAILVNRDGERFTDETKTPWLELPKERAGEGFILIDSRLGELLSKWPNYISTAPGVAYAYLEDYRRNRQDIFHSGASARELAAKIGAPAEKLERTIAAMGEAGAAWKPPFVALGPLQSWIVLTEGGLAIDTTMRVVDQEDQPIAGLYAAGSNGQGGLLLDGHGNHIGWAVISGRQAAHSIARRLREAAQSLRTPIAKQAAATAGERQTSP